MANDQYDCEVNRGDLSMHWLKDTLNDRWADGWRCLQVLSQGGNTIVVFERRTGT